MTSTQVENDEVNNFELEEEEEEEGDDGEVKYVPRCFKWTWLRPISCLFSNHGEGNNAGENVPSMRHDQWLVLWCCCFVGYLGMLDWEFLPLCLNMIQLDLNISEAQVGFIMSAVRLGNCLSFPICSCADYFGRKRVMLFSTGAFLVLSFFTGLSPNVQTFTACQVIARGFMTAQNTLSTTMLVETLDAKNRGWGVGFYSAISILGNATALLVFAFVGDSRPWRYLYCSSLGLVPVLFYFYRNTPETRRFLEAKEKKRANKNRIGPIEQEGEELEKKNQQQSNEGSGLREKVNWKRVYVIRFIACLAVSFCDGFAFAPSETFKIKKLQTVHGLKSFEVSLIMIGTGLLAFSSFALSGSLSDKYGRKTFLIVFNTMCAIGVIIFFLSTTWVAFVANFFQLLAGFVLMTVKSAYFAELFPISQRATAQGLLTATDYVAGGISLSLESVLYASLNNHWVACALLAIPGLLAGPIIYCFLNDTASKDLDDISPEYSSPAKARAITKSKRELELTVI